MCVKGWKEEMTAFIMLAAILTAGCIFSAYHFLSVYRKEEFVRGFWRKGAAALFFVAVGVVLLLSKGASVFAWLVVGGLVLGLCGDQLLAMRLIHRKYHDLFFTIGALSFGIGHGLYVLALRHVGMLRVSIILPVFSIGAVLSLVYAVKMGTNVGKKTPLAVGYIAVVLLMGSIAVGAAIDSMSLGGLLFAVGGILFCVSDNILCAYCYGKEPVWNMNRDLHIAYYGAQLAIAWSILFI